jgi:hypothetical protein
MAGNSKNMYDQYMGYSPNTELWNANNYLDYTPSGPQVTVGNDMGVASQVSSTRGGGNTADTAGNAAITSGNPYLMAAGLGLKAYGQYQAGQDAKKAAREEKRRLNRAEAFKYAQATGQNRRLAQSHDANMRTADFNFGNAYQDRLLEEAAYKGV